MGWWGDGGGRGGGMGGGGESIPLKSNYLSRYTPLSSIMLSFIKKIFQLISTTMKSSFDNA